MPAVPSGDFFSEAFLQYSDAAGASHTIVFDAVLDEQWEEPATITEHPVEQGANIADHVRVALVKCTLKVRVTNQPLDSNQFADPIGGAGQSTSLAVTVPTPNQPEFSGIVAVPMWNSNLTLSTAIVGAASFASGIATGIATGVAKDVTGQGSASPLGDRVAAGLKPSLEPAETGNKVLSYPNPPAVPGGGLVGSVVRLVDNLVGGAAGAAVLGAVTSLIPPGEEIDVPTATDAGLPGGSGIPNSLTAQTVQFATPTDFAESMMALLVGLKNSAQVFVIFGSKQTLGSMVIETLTMHRGAPEDTGTGADITIGLKEIRVVSTNTIAVPLPKVPRANTPLNKGAQDPTSADPAKMESLFHKGLTGALNYFSHGGP